MAKTYVKGNKVEASAEANEYTELKVYEDGKDETGKSIKYLKQTLKLNPVELQRQKDNLINEKTFIEEEIADIDIKLGLIAEEE